MFLRQSTASQSREVGPFVSDTDFKTVQTGLTIANTDVKLSANGAAGASKNSGGGTHRNNGMYGLTFDATDTATVGELTGSVVVAGALPVAFKFFVVEEAVYDALFVASAPGYVVDQPVNVTKLLGTAWLAPGTAGTPDVNVKLWNALATVELPLVPTTAGRKLDVSAGGEAGLDWANVGSPTTALALTGTTIATTQKVDLETIKTNPVVNAGTVTFPTTATLASTTNITAGTVTTATNVTTVNGLAAGVVTATSIAADAITAAKVADGTIDAATFAAGAINAAAIAADAITDAKVAADVTIASVTGAVGSVTGAVGSVTGSVGSVVGAVGSVTGAVGSVTGNVGGNVTGSVGSVVGAVGSVTVVSDKTGYALSTAGNASVADKLLGRTIAGGADGGRMVKDSLRFNRNKFTIVAGTLTVYEEDDTTIAWTATITQTAGNPVSASDPA